MNEEFKEVVDRYLETATEIESKTSMPQASSSMLFATACYNSQYIIEQAKRTKAIKIESMVSEHIEMYEEMLRNSIKFYSDKLNT